MTIDGDGLKIAIAGATGAVGREMLNLLQESELPVAQLVLAASSRSAGQELVFRGKSHVVECLDNVRFQGIDLALFSAGSSISREVVPRVIESGAVVVDNSSAFRMDEGVPLVVPEVNASACHQHQGLVANPNCSTIQMVLPLEVLNRDPGLSRVIVSTYQSASGAGQAGIDELLLESQRALKGETLDPVVFPHPLAFDVLPQIGAFDQGGYTEEELKMVHETRKILSLPGLDVSATCVRVPVFRGHSEAVTVDLAGDFDLQELLVRLGEFPNLTVLSGESGNNYPTCRVSQGSCETYLGRVRKDCSRSATVHFWVVSDNLLKGAAFNAVQIAEYIAVNRLYG